MQRSATAVWRRGLKDGSGSISVPSGVLHDTPYSFVTRFENQAGTNPEELIAAAHASCFSMALSAQLVTQKFVPEHVSTKATVTLESLNGGWTISKVHLEVSARVPNIAPPVFQDTAATAKANCPVSRLLKAEITMTAKLDTNA